MCVDLYVIHLSGRPQLAREKKEGFNSRNSYMIILLGTGCWKKTARWKRKKRDLNFSVCAWYTNFGCATFKSRWSCWCWQQQQQQQQWFKSIAKGRQKEWWSQTTIQIAAAATAEREENFSFCASVQTVSWNWKPISALLLLSSQPYCR